MDFLVVPAVLETIQETIHGIPMNNQTRIGKKGGRELPPYRKARR